MSVNTLSQLQTSLLRARADTLGEIATVAQTAAGAISDITPIMGTLVIPATESAEAWIEDSGETTAYKYHIDIAADVTAQDVAIVSIARAGMAIAIACGMCPQSETLAGKIRLRAKAVPLSQLTAEYVILRQ